MQIKTYDVYVAVYQLCLYPTKKLDMIIILFKM